MALPNIIIAQARFISSGKVEFEKKVNMHKLIEDNTWTRELKERLPATRITYYDLYFNANQTLYKTGKAPAEDKWKNFWGASQDEENMTLQQLDAGLTQAIKQVFERKYLLEDSLLAIDWRITDETRDIAGFECRKAVGRLFDTLYVVAFYTDQIMVSGGPEGYHGLPGLILGLAFPRYYTTWFATKVELAAPKPSELALPNTGKLKKATRAEIMTTVKTALRGDSEEEKQRTIWQIVL
ncbi:MAG TPA: GLPGLI family protein [Phnomibacter sp.]|nr:GLPGLI family protein [Phnomibacter sp.]